MRAGPRQKLDQHQRVVDSPGALGITAVHKGLRHQCELCENPVPPEPEASRIGVDLKLEGPPVQSENSSSSRPPFVAAMQSADLGQFNCRSPLWWLNRSGLWYIFRWVC